MSENLTTAAGTAAPGSVVGSTRALLAWTSLLAVHQQTQPTAE